MELTRETANQAACAMLKGAQLDEIRVNGMQISIKFLSDKIAPGSLIEVNLVFVCRATVLREHSDCRPSDENKEDFHLERARFLFEIYGLYGGLIGDVSISKDSLLKIEISSSEVILFCDSDSLLVDDWVWSISLEKDVGIKIAECKIKSISCVPGSAAAKYYSDCYN